MTDAELQTVREKLNPYFVPYAQKPKNYKHTMPQKSVSNSAMVSAILTAMVNASVLLMCYASYGQGVIKTQRV